MPKLNKINTLSRLETKGFISTLIKTWALSPTFEPAELYHYTSFQKVLEVLSKLSKHEDAKRLHIVPFPQSPDYDEVPSDEDLYSTLPRLLDQDEPDGLSTRVAG